MPRGQPNDLKEQLRAINQPRSGEDNEAFEELCKIAFGRLKQYMNSHNMPYLQMSEIVLKAMSDLKRKQNVNNQFTMYSAMIKRQVEQLFEAHIKPVQAFTGQNKELVPDWFDKRNEPVISSAIDVDFEAERVAILEKLNS